MKKLVCPHCRKELKEFTEIRQMFEILEYNIKEKFWYHIKDDCQYGESEHLCYSCSECGEPFSDEMEKYIKDEII